MPQNLVSLVITAEQQAAVLSAIATIEANLPGLITLEPNERRRRSMMGPKSERFARGVLEALQQNAALVPPGLELNEATADLRAMDMLRPILLGLRALTARTEDTDAALGSDLMDVAQTGYGMLKMLGHEHGLGDLRKEFGYRWARGRRKPATLAE